MSSTSAETLAGAFLAVEREHQRTAVLEERAGDAWRGLPDWRFARQVIRIALYLRERAGVAPGDRVAILSPIRSEAIVAQWAAVAQGAVSAAVDPELPDDALAAALQALAPRAIFVAGAPLLGRVRSLRPQAAPPIVIGEAGEGGRAWTEVLDLGGSLDTAERANAFRDRCRAVVPEAAATADVRAGAAVHVQRQRELLLRARELGARPGDVAYVAAGGMHCPIRRQALWAFVADGVTRTLLGTPGHEPEEMETFRPHKIVAPSEILSRTRQPPAPRSATVVTRIADEARRRLGRAGDGKPTAWAGPRFVLPTERVG